MSNASQTLLWLLLGCCFSRGLRGSKLVVECDIVEHKAGLNGTVDDITALRAMKNRKVILFASTSVRLLFRRCRRNLHFPPILLKNAK